jgi:hypothetical protein
MDDGTLGYTNDQITRLWTSRYAEKVGTSFRVSFQSVPLSPPPTADEAWVEFQVFLGGSSFAGVAPRPGVPYKLGALNQVRSSGVVRVSLNYPGNDTRTPNQFGDIIGACFTAGGWYNPNVWLQPPTLQDQLIDRGRSKVTVEMRFTYLRRVDLPDKSTLTPLLAAALRGNTSLY